MNKEYLWTKSGARLSHIRSQGHGIPYNWIFLPGGPGLGSASLAELTENFPCPGNLWCLDLPGDGSNTTPDDMQAFSHWSQALVEAVTALDHVILVAHSTGGMYALSIPHLEEVLSGLVLMDSAPDASWQNEFMTYVAAHPLPEVTKLQEIYETTPNNDLLRDMVVASIPYFCARGCPPEKFDFLKALPYNFRATAWSANHFDATYKAKWVPKIPTLIIAGDQDHITPLSLFKQSPHFHHDNIMIEEIPQAGHYPWIENPADVYKAFERYFREFECYPSLL